MITSHILWLLPIALAWFAGQPVWTVAAVVMMVLSLTYHLTKNNIADRVDTVGAILFLLAGPWILYQGQASFIEWALACSVLVCALGCYVVARIQKTVDSYISWHVRWHFFSTILCATVYACAFW